MDRIVLTASEGMMLTNGEIFAKRLELGDWDFLDNYYEISEEEYEDLIHRASSTVQARSPFPEQAFSNLEKVSPQVTDEVSPSPCEAGRRRCHEVTDEASGEGSAEVM